MSGKPLRSGVGWLKKRPNESSKAGRARPNCKKIGSELIVTAPTILKVFLEELDTEIRTTQNTLPTTFHLGSDRDDENMKKTPHVISNGPSLRRRIKALLAARARVLQMLLEPLTVKQITSELYRLRLNLPEVVDEQINARRAALLFG